MSNQTNTAQYLTVVLPDTTEGEAGEIAEYLLIATSPHINDVKVRVDRVDPEVPSYFDEITGADMLRHVVSNADHLVEDGAAQIIYVLRHLRTITNTFESAYDALDEASKKAAEDFLLGF